jgi:1-acyl-sn-glycerol-3-phosphate acyltransferase
VLRRFGAVPASVENAEHALDLGAGVIAYPGGALDVYRPWTERNRIDFHDHAGFVRLALHSGVPVFPTVSHGSHHSIVVVSRGDRLACLLGLDRLRIDVFPLIVGVPFGLSSVLAPYIPLPAKIVVEVLEPVDWTSYGPDAAGDPTVVRQCYDEITGRMQVALDRLARELPHPLWSGLLRVGSRWARPPDTHSAVGEPGQFRK